MWNRKISERLLWLLVGPPSAFGPELVYRLRVAQPSLMDVHRYFWYYYILCSCTTFLLPLRFGWLLVLSLFKADCWFVLLITLLLRLVGMLGTRQPIWRHQLNGCCYSDRPKSVRNRWVIEVFGGVFVLLIDCWIFSWFNGLRHRTESDIVLFILIP